MHAALAGSRATPDALPVAVDRGMIDNLLVFTGGLFNPSILIHPHPSSGRLDFQGKNEAEWPAPKVCS